LALLAAAAAVLATSTPARARLARSGPWLGFGLAWFGLATASLTTVFPSWQPNRSQFGSVGLGLAAVPTLAPAHPRPPPGPPPVRLGALALAPGPANAIAEQAPETGAFMDYARLTRLQRFMRETRLLLHRRSPHLPPGSIVVQENLPHSLEYAFGGDHALHVWYTDSTLHWLPFDA